MIGNAFFNEQITQNMQHMIRVQPVIDMDREALPRIFVNDCQEAKFAAIGKALGDKIITPDMVLPTRPQTNTRAIIPPVNEEDPERLFEPFVSSKSHDKSGGRGLGLSLVAKVVGDHGGVIEFDSEPGATAFRLMLPAAQPEVPGEDLREEQGP